MARALTRLATLRHGRYTWIGGRRGTDRLGEVASVMDHKTLPYASYWLRADLPGAVTVRRRIDGPAVGIHVGQGCIRPIGIRRRSGGHVVGAEYRGRGDRRRPRLQMPLRGPSPDTDYGAWREVYWSARVEGSLSP